MKIDRLFFILLVAAIVYPALVSAQSDSFDPERIKEANERLRQREEEHKKLIASGQLTTMPSTRPAIKAERTVKVWRATADAPNYVKLWLSYMDQPTAESAKINTQLIAAKAKLDAARTRRVRTKQETSRFLNSTVTKTVNDPEDERLRQQEIDSQREAVASLAKKKHDAEKAELSAPQKLVLPTLELRVDGFGSAEGIRVVSVIPDSNDFIGEWAGKELYFRGFGTKNLVDGNVVYFPAIHIKGTARWGGATMYDLEPVELSRYVEQVEVPASSEKSAAP